MYMAVDEGGQWGIPERCRAGKVPCHIMIAGTRIPPSARSRFLPLNGPAKPASVCPQVIRTERRYSRHKFAPFSGPLSLVNKTKVLLAMFSSSSRLSNRPIFMSIFDIMLAYFASRSLANFPSYCE
jgi:hypothetical protein